VNDRRIGVLEAATVGDMPVATVMQAMNGGTLRHVRVGPRRVLQTTEMWVNKWKSIR
jgi:hypothetical protein